MADQFSLIKANCMECFGLQYHYIIQIDRVQLIRTTEVQV